MHRSNHKQALKPVALLLLLAVAGAAPGCLWAPDLVMIRKDIERQLPGASFEREIELTLDPVSLVFARLVTHVVPDARVASGYLRDVSRIELAIYSAEKMPPKMAVSMPERLQSLQESEDWELAVKIRDDNELLWILYQIDGDTVKALYVVVLNDDQLVLVKVEGRLERLVAYALKESGALEDFPGSKDSFLSQ